MGSAFRLPVVRRLPLDLVAHEIGKLDGVVVGAAATGAVDYADFNWKRPTMLVIGNEGAGLSSDALSTISETVSSPLVSPVESRNAGIAAAVILFEAARQRGRG
jgi:TrmH family RNA methyltransferase